MLNPRGQLPTFKDGDVVVNESLAAILYLEEAYTSGTQLLPADPKAKAKVRGEATPVAVRWGSLPRPRQLFLSPSSRVVFSVAALACSILCW